MRAGRRGLAHEQAELVLQQRIEPARRLVEDEQLGTVHERLHEPELLAVALRELADRPVEHDTEALDERVPQPRIDRSAETGEGSELLVAREPVVQAQVAGQVADAPAGGDAVAAAVEPEHERLTFGGPNHVEQQPDRRALAGPVRPQEAEDLSVLDAQVEAG